MEGRKTEPAPAAEAAATTTGSLANRARLIGESGAMIRNQ
jgi:hypothetical protein